MIAVDRRLNSTLLSSCEENGCEQIWVKITGKNLKLVVASVYIPPSMPLEIYSAHIECIKRMCNTIKHDTNVMIYGDFNLPDLKWKLDDLTNSMVPVNITTSIESEVLQNCHDSGLYQINDILNDNSRLLDLVWTNNPEKFECNLCLNHLLPNEIHHKAITVDFYHIDSHPIPHDREFYLDFKNANYDQINTALIECDWNSILGNG